MRFIGFTKSKRGTEVHTFQIGRDEMKLILNLTKENLGRFPKITETQVIRARLKDLRNKFDEALKSSPQ